MRPTTNLTEYELKELLERRTQMREYARKKRAAIKAATPPKDPVVYYKLSETEAAYIAGFFDGEGMVAISRCRPKKKSGNLINYNYTLLAQLSQSSLPVLEWISERCGGCIIKKARERRHTRSHWKLTFKSLGAKRLLEQLMPHLIVKREEAVHGLCFQELQALHKNRYEVGRTGPVPRTAEELAYKEHYFLLLKKLKHP